MSRFYVSILAVGVLSIAVGCSRPAATYESRTLCPLPMFSITYNLVVHLEQTAGRLSFPQLDAYRRPDGKIRPYAEIVNVDDPNTGALTESDLLLQHTLNALNYAKFPGSAFYGAMVDLRLAKGHSPGVDRSEIYYVLAVNLRSTTDLTESPLLQPYLDGDGYFVKYDTALYVNNPDGSPNTGRAIMTRVLAQFFREHQLPAEILYSTYQAAAEECPYDAASRPSMRFVPVPGDWVG